MRKKSVRLLLGACVLCCVCFLLQGTSAHAARYVRAVTLKNVQAEWIPDGDTVHLRSGEKVRLVGIDTPETGKDGKPAQYGAKAAKKRLRHLLKGQQLTIRSVKPHRDKYDRILGEVFLPNGTLVNELLLREGHAYYYWFKGLPQQIKSRYRNAQNQAILGGAGFWPHILDKPLSQAPWVGNRRSRRAFPKGSYHAKRLSPRNQVLFLNLREALLKGYSPSRQYSPWREKAQKNLRKVLYRAMKSRYKL